MIHDTEIVNVTLNHELNIASSTHSKGELTNQMEYLACFSRQFRFE